MFATFKRNILTKKRAYPIEFFVGNYINLLFMVLSSFIIYHFVFEGKLSKEFSEFSGTNDYMSFVIIGSFIYLFVVRTFVNVGRSYITEIREGTIEVLMITPYKPKFYLLGIMLEQTILTSIELLIISFTIIPFGLKFYSFDIYSFIIVFIISLFSFFGMAVILGALMVYLKDTFIVQNTAYAIINLLIGVSFPIDYLPNIVKWISFTIPATYSLELFRSIVINGRDISDFPDYLIIFAFLSFLYCAIGLILMNRFVNKAVENKFI